MEITQQEKNGIVCVTVKGCKEARLSPELERTIKAILKRLKGCLIIQSGFSRTLPVGCPS